MMRIVVLLVLLLLSSSASALAQLGPCAQVLGPRLPDLTVDRAMLRAQLYVTEETFGEQSCSVVEGCVTAPGTHLLLRFMSSTPNIGTADLFIGNPQNCLGSLYQFSECHQHIHFKEYSDYRLWTEEGYRRWVDHRDLARPTNSGHNAQLLDAARRDGDLVVGRKQGFCVIDIFPFKFGDVEPGPPVYTSCGFQGIKVGWADQYVPQLACQFVQMTDVPEGDYVLEVQVNPEQLFPELDYTNNASAVRFHFRPKQGRSGPVVEVIE